MRYFSGTWTFLATITAARGASVTGNVSVTSQTSTTGGPGTMSSNPAKPNAYYRIGILEQSDFRCNPSPRCWI